MEYTKGEWKVHWFEHPVVSTTLYGRSHPIAEIIGTDANKAENAHLIAAAPEMYELLKELRRFLEQLDNDEDAHPGLNILLGKSFVTLAKAEGKP